MKILNIILIIVSFLMLLTLGSIETDVFIKRGIVYWNPYKPIDWDSFRGYPNKLSDYSAAISSYFDYKILNESIDSIRVEAFMLPHHSWANKSGRESEYALRHEQTHFKISELVARKFRKTISKMPKVYLNKYHLKKVYHDYLYVLSNMQNQYDEEADHGAILEIQKDWDYKVDSLLNEYAYYSSPVIDFAHVEIRSNYYRQIDIDAYNQIVGKFPVDSNNVSLTMYYKFYYLNDKLSKIEFWNKCELVPDVIFKVPVVKINHDKNIEWWSFYDANGNKVKNNDNIYSIKLVKERKKIIKYFIGIDSLPCENSMGVSKIVWELDHKDRKVVGRFYNISNKQITDKEGYCILKYKYDKFDNVIENGNYNIDNNRAELKNGIAYYMYCFDEKNNAIEIRNYNSKGIQCQDTNGYAIVNLNYDINGNIIRRSFKKADERVYLSKNRIAITYYDYDENSNLIEERNYGLNKNLIMKDGNIGKLKRKYDSQGRMIEVINYDAYDNLLNSTMGCCKIKYFYNSLNQVIKEEQYCINRFNNLDFLKCVFYLYDEENNVTSERYLTEFLKPLADSNAVYLKRYQYDKFKNIIKIENYNKNNTLQPVERGVAMFKYKYDINNNLIEKSTYDIKRELTLSNNNTKIEKYEYNSQNLISEQKCYDENGQLSKNIEGVEVVKCEYDTNKNMVKQSFFNKDDRLIENNIGIAYLQYSYDKNHNNTLIECYNSDFKLTEDGNNGIAIVKYDYNSDNELLKISYYDYEYNLKEVSEGYACEQNTFDQLGKVIKKEFLSKFNQPVVTIFGYASIEYQYDKNENIVVRIYHDENDELIADKDGYSIYNWVYDRNGEVVETYKYPAEKKYINQIKAGPFSVIVRNPYYSQYSKSLRNDYNDEDDEGNKAATYYENGQKRDEVTYINGRAEGKFTSWYQNGSIESVMEYHDGMKNGKKIEYYKNGQKESECEYENNNLVFGSQISWYENGKIRSKYENGELKEWDKKGNLIKD